MFLGLMVVFGDLTSRSSVGYLPRGDHVDASDLVPAAAGILIAASLGSSIGPITGAFVMDKAGPGGLFQFTAFVGFAVGIFAVYRMVRSEAPAMEEQGPYVAYARTSAIFAELDPRGEFIEEVEPNVMDEALQGFSHDEVIESAVEAKQKNGFRRALHRK